MHFAISDCGVATAATSDWLGENNPPCSNGVGFAPLKSEMIARLQNDEADAAAWLISRRSCKSRAIARTAMRFNPTP